MPGVNWRIRYIVDEASKKKVTADAQEQARDASGRFVKAGEEGGKGFAKGMRSGFKQVEGEAKTMGSRISGFFKSTFGQLAAFFGLHRLILLGRDVLKMGMDSAETANKFSVTFGAAEKSVQKFVDSWAAIAGLDKNEAKDFLATTASIIQGLGGSQQAAADLSVQVAKMAGDLTSFSNIPIAQTSQAITRALTGEYEALKTLGIAVNMEMIQDKALIMTHKARKDELTKLDTAMAAAALVQEQMKVQTGDLENTQNSLANTSRRAAAEWRNLKIAVGEAITETSEVPAIVGAISNALTGSIKWFKAHKTEVKDWAGNIIQFTAWAVRGLAVTVGSIVKLFFNAGQVIGNMFELSYNGFKLFIQEVANGIIIDLNRLLDFSNKHFKTKFELFNFKESGKTKTRIDELTTSITKNMLDMGDAVTGARDAWDELGISVESAGKKMTKGISGVRGTGTTTGDKVLTPEEIKKAAKAAADAIKEQREAEEQEVETLVKGYKLRMLNREELEKMLRLERDWRARSLDSKLSLQDRMRARGLADQIKDTGYAGPLAAIGPISTSPIGAKTGERMAKELEDQEEKNRLYFERIADYAEGAADTIESHFARAFQNMQGDMSAVEALAGAAFTSIGEMATESIRKWAGTKVKENIAAALQAAAYALGFTAVGNFPSSGAAWASAAQHTAAALAWGALAGGATAAGQALGSGGGRGGGSGRVDSDAAAKAAAEAKEKGPDIHVHIRPWDRHNPVVQEEIGEASRLYQERFGGTVTVVNDG